jgi:hypothetical protein
VATVDLSQPVRETASERDCDPSELRMARTVAHQPCDAGGDPTVWPRCVGDHGLCALLPRVGRLLSCRARPRVACGAPHGAITTPLAAAARLGAAPRALAQYRRHRRAQRDARRAVGCRFSVDNSGMAICMLVPRCCECRAALDHDSERRIFACVNPHCAVYDPPRPGRCVVLAHANSHHTWAVRLR